MIDVKTAATTATQYLKSFFPTIQNIQIEEVELTDDGKIWVITLSYSEPGMTAYIFTPQGPPRSYKIFKIDANKGNVLSMKIRSVS